EEVATTKPERRISTPIGRVRLLPLSLAHTHVCGIGRIVANPFLVVLIAAAALAFRLTTDALLRSVNGWSENLLAVVATPAQTHARFLFSSGSFIGIGSLSQRR